MASLLSRRRLFLENLTTSFYSVTKLNLTQISMCLYYIRHNIILVLGNFIHTFFYSFKPLLLTIVSNLCLSLFLNLAYLSSFYFTFVHYSRFSLFNFIELHHSCLTNSFKTFFLKPIYFLPTFFVYFTLKLSDSFFVWNLVEEIRSPLHCFIRKKLIV